MGAPPSSILPFVSSGTSLTYNGLETNGEYNFTLNLGFGFSTNRMRGKFHRRFHHFDVGPSIHTKWVKEGKVVEGRVHLEMFRVNKRVEVAGGSLQIPLEGTFVDSKEISYPAIIEFPFGAVVKLYDTKSGTWFSLSSYPYESSP